MLTLDHFTTDQHLFFGRCRTGFSLSIKFTGTRRWRSNPQVGDECLLLAGLFPERAARKHVSVDYFVGIGQQAYQLLTHAHFKWLYDQALFAKLSKDFPNLISVLQAMRKIHKDPLQ